MLFKSRLSWIIHICLPERFEATDDRLDEPDSEPDPILARFFLLRPMREPDPRLLAREAGEPDLDLDLDRDLDFDFDRLRLDPPEPMDNLLSGLVIIVQCCKLA